MIGLPNLDGSHAPSEPLGIGGQDKSDDMSAGGWTTCETDNVAANKKVTLQIVELADHSINWMSE